MGAVDRVAVLAAAGWRQPKLAMLTGLAEREVERRLGGIQDGLGASSLDAAVDAAAELGLVERSAGFAA